MNSATQPASQPGQPEPAPPLLQIKELKTWFSVEEGVAKAVDGVSLEIQPDEAMGIVGESGSGKSVTALSVMRLVPQPPGMIAGGEIWFEGRDLLKLSHVEMRKVRGNHIGMIFQEPMTSLNPVFTVGMQVLEAVRTHQSMPKAAARELAIDMLDRVGIPAAHRRVHDYPHQFSGGMRQRVMIAMALICDPRLLIADEPTTALDVTTQAQIMEMMLELKEQRGGSLLLITHDLAVVAETCQRVAVMYGGKVQEIGEVQQLYNEPLHPYTQGLLASLPARQAKRHSRLQAIPGNVPSIMEMPTGCKFCTRCPEAFERCEQEEPKLIDLGGGRQVRCHLHEESSQ